MTTFYLDPVNGNDANDGTSFATRWQTIGQGATSARIRAGDTIRIIESPSPINMGIDATFTKNVSTTTTPTANSNVLTLSEAVTINIDTCDGIWSGVTNVTVTSPTAIIQGTNSAQIAISASFTTGKAAFHTVTQNNYTGYTRVSYWLSQSAGTMAVAGDYSLALCSDTLGNVPVVTMPIPAMKNAVWRPVVFDYAGDLPSNINSIALIVNVDRGAVTFVLDNVYACLPESNPKALTGKHLVSRNVNGEEWWMPVRGLSGTTLSVYQTNPAAGWGWTEDTQTVALWSRLPIYQQRYETTQTGTTYSNVGNAGTLGNPITFSGGWDSTDMSTQTSETLIDGVHSWGYGIRIGRSYVNVEKLSFMRFDRGVSIHAQPSGEVVGCNVSVDGVTRNQTYGAEVYPQSYKIRDCALTVNNIVGNGSGFSGAVGTQPIGNCVVTLGNVCRNSGSGVSIANFYGSTLMVDNINENYATNFLTSSTYFSSQNKITINKCLNGARNNVTGSTNLSLLGISNSTISLGEVDTTYRTAVKTLEFNGSNNNTVSINSIKAKNDGNGSSSGIDFSSSTGNIITIQSYSGFTVANKLFVDKAGCNNTIYGPTTNFSAGVGNGRTTLPNFGGSLTDHRTYDRFGTIFSDSSIVNTPGINAISWKMTSNSNCSSSFPLTFLLAKVFVNANTTTTFSCYVRRSALAGQCGLKILGGIVSGIPDDVISLSSADIDTWVQISITATPTESTVIEIYAINYGAAGSAWFDDFSVV